MTLRSALALGRWPLVLAGVTAAAGLDASTAAMARSATDGIMSCRSIDASEERLACYDSEALKLVPPRFQGRLNLITERFEITEPTRLRYQSDGAIFVLYVKSGNDEVVQNLHIGGGGEDIYVIEKPGTYFLQINGSESWRIWLEPIGPEATH